MEILKIDAKYDTPKVILDQSNNVFEITGRSIPEDATEFYSPVIKWIEDYSKSPNKNTCFVFKLDYINTSSSRVIQNILLSLKKIGGIKIEWLYKEDDQDLQDAGSDFAELIQFPIDIKSY
jgi:hypothetical protein